MTAVSQSPHLTPALSWPQVSPPAPPFVISATPPSGICQE